MGRLIDADAFYKRYCEMYEDGVDEGEIDRVAYMLSTEPTAYDVDNVIAELEALKTKYEKLRAVSDDGLEANELHTRCLQIDKDVEIVKRGGVE